MTYRSLPDPVATRRARSGWGVRMVYAGLVTLLALGITWMWVRSYIYMATPGIVTAPLYIVSTPYDARVTEIYVKPGSRVSEGQRLATVRSPSINSLQANLVTALADQTSSLANLRIRLSAASASVPSARQRVERSQMNLDRLERRSCSGTSNFCSDIFREHALATGALAELEAEVGELRTQIEEIAKTRKDISDLNDTVNNAYRGGHQVSWTTGIVGPHIVHPGQSVTAGDAIVSVYDDRNTHVEWVLDGSRMHQPQVGDPVYVMDGNHVLRGRITEILGIADAAVTSRSLFDTPINGQIVHVELEEGEPYPPLLSTVEVRYNYWRSLDGAVGLFIKIIEASGLWRNE